MKAKLLFPFPFYPEQFAETTKIEVEIESIPPVNSHLIYMGNKYLIENIITNLDTKEVTILLERNF